MAATDQTPSFFTTKQAADLLGVSAPTVIKWVEEGRLRAHRTPGGHRRIPVEALRAFENECRQFLGKPTQAGNKKSGQVRVLVVDPEHDYSDLVSEYFRLQGDVHVVQAIDPLTVGFQIGAFEPHVVIFDISCPRIHVREIIQLASRLTGVRVVLLSTSWSGELRGITADHPGVVAVEKPLKLDQLWRLAVEAD